MIRNFNFEMTAYSKSSLRLFLFSDMYPCGKAEPFLETEIRYLANRFSKVIVAPNRIVGTRRRLPNGVSLETSLGRRKAAGRTRRLACFGSPVLYREFFSHPSTLMRWRALKQVVSYLAEAQRVYLWLLSYIQHHKKIRDILFYTYWLSPTSLAISMAKTHFPDLQLISRAHGWDLYDERHLGSYLPYRRKMLRQINSIFLISEHGKRYLSKKYPMFQDRYHVSRLGVIDPGFTTSQSTDGVFRVVSCSSLAPLKRLDRLVEGLGLFAQSRPRVPVEWRHIGDGPLRNELEFGAGNVLPSNVRFVLHGQLPNKEVIDFYKTHSVDVFVNVSEFEGVPVSIMEAQSCGIPVIAPAVGGIPEIVNNENGVLLKSRPTASCIANALERIISCPSETLSRKHAGKSTWKSMCNAETNYTAFAESIIRSFRH
ncbi:MAG: glycosyltransferase [Desulfobacterales bacterium]|nr:glycosyltransferase [Desulfobacterales bacterium]